MEDADVLRATVDAALAELRAVTTTLTWHQLVALRRRLWLGEHDTYHGRGLPVSVLLREREQIEADFEAEVRQVVTGDGPAARWCNDLRDSIAPAVPLARLFARHPALELPAVTPNVPVWRVLARFGAVFDVASGWAAVPGLASVVAATKTGLAGLDGRTPAAVLADQGFALDSTDLLGWLSYCGYRVTPADLDRPLHRPLNGRRPGTALAKRGSRDTPSATDSTAELLEQAGTPLHLDEILKRLPRKFSRNPLYNRLNADTRFRRVEPSTFALAGWDIEPYAGQSGSSADIAVRLITAEGKPLHLDDIRRLLGKPISREGLRNALNASDRLVRVAPSTYDIRPTPEKSSGGDSGISLSP